MDYIKFIKFLYDKNEDIFYLYENECSNFIELNDNWNV